MRESNGLLNKLAAIFTLFRFATRWDLLLLLLGILAAIAHGVALPISMYYFGILTNIFVNHFTSKTLANFEFHFDPIDLLDSMCLQFIDLDLFLSGFINFTALSGGVVNCSDDFILIEQNITFNIALNCGVTRLAECVDDATFIPEVDRYVLGFFYIGIIVFLVGTLQIFSFQVTSDRQMKHIKERFFHALLYQESKWYDRTSSGELSSRLSSDMEKIHEGIGVKLAVFIQWVTTFIAGFVVGFVREWRLTLLLLGMTPLIILTVVISYTFILVLTSREQRQFASASAVVEEALTSIRTVVAYGGESVEANRYHCKLQEVKNTSRNRVFTLSLSFAIIYSFIFLCYAIGFWFSAWLISQQAVQAGDAFTVFFAVIVGMFSLGQAIPHLEKFVSAAGASIAVFSIIDQDPSRRTAAEDTADTKQTESSIEFVGVNFSYPSRPDIPVLNNFTLKIAAGQTVALVGPSGCGKSTAIQLLMRFYEIDGAQLLVGGIDIRSLNLNNLRSKFGFVSQEPILFDTTVAENIGFGKNDATRDEIESAGKDANVHEFVSRSLPNGYDTDVGKQGAQMSGGQKQRIAIARALIRAPSILLLDDATSALDSESERIVQATLDKASTNRTTIIVSHRLSTIKNADLIAYMESGTIMEVGTHEELMGRKGAYYEFSSTQNAEASSESMVVPMSPVNKGDVEFLRSESVASNGMPSWGGMEMRDLKDKPQSEKVSIPWARVWRLNSSQIYLVFLGLLGATVRGVIYPLFAFFFGQVIRVYTLPFDRVLGEIHIWASTFLILGVIAGIATFVKYMALSAFGIELSHLLQLRSFKSILLQEMAWFDQKKNSPSYLTTRIADDAVQIQGAIGVEFGTLVETVVSILVAIVVSLWVNQLLALVVMGFLPFLIVPGVLQVAILATHISRYKKRNDEAEKIATDSITNHQTVRALSVEEKLHNTYSRKLQNAYKFSYLTGIGYGFTYAFAQGALFLGYAITFRFGAYQSVQPINGPMYEGLGDIYTVFMALIFGFLVLGQSYDFFPTLTKAMNAASRVFPLLDRHSAVDSSSDEGIKMDQDHSTGEVSLRNVFFNYPTRPGVSVMQDMTLFVPANKTTALVGPSGYGKSTVMALLERFYDPIAGSITIDGKELSEVNIQWLRQQIGIVFQEPVLFDRSIAENISYGANHRPVSMDEVEQAAKNASIHNFIESLPLGYKTMVGESGALLSRGQKQRIAIARALLRDPKLLLLDEATSALDPENEREVQSVLDQAMKNRTSIVIAHRLSTIFKADKIAMLKGGKVSQEGSHSELMKEGGLYRKMYLYQTERK